MKWLSIFVVVISIMMFVGGNAFSQDTVKWSAPIHMYPHPWTPTTPPPPPNPYYGYPYMGYGPYAGYYGQPGYRSGGYWGSEGQGGTYGYYRNQYQQPGLP